MTRSSLAAVALATAALTAVPAAPATAKPCSLMCMLENAVKCNQIAVDGQVYTVCWPL